MESEMVIGYVKSAFALAAAGLAGVAVGAFTVGRMAQPKPTGNAVAPLLQTPAWVSGAKTFYAVAAVGAGVALLAWMYVDYRYHRGEA